jgi:hypothetical protein
MSSAKTTAKCGGLLSSGWRALAGVVAVTIAVIDCPRMTRERLHRLVGDLAGDKAAAALTLFESQLGGESDPASLPEFFGTLRSGTPSETWQRGLRRSCAPCSAAVDYRCVGCPHFAPAR